VTATVPAARGIVQREDIVSGVAVRARTWLDAAELANWSSGNGEVLVPAYSPEQSVPAGSTRVFRYRITPPGRAVRRVWVLYLEGNSAITIDGNVGPSADYITDSGGTWVRYVEDLTAKSSALQEISLSIANAASSASLEVKSIACFEDPRIVLDKDATDLGVELTSVAVREPIQENLYTSMGGIAAALGAEQRRQYFNVARPDNTTDAWSTTSGTFSIMLDEVPILARKLLPADTTGNVRFAAYCSASDATTDGEIRITNNATGNTVTLTVTDPGTTFAWFTIDFPTDILCEDLSEATGWPDGALLTTVAKTLDIDFRRSGGAGTFYVATIAAIEY
jgi:hypothetical protein